MNKKRLGFLFVVGIFFMHDVLRPQGEWQQWIWNHEGRRLVTTIVVLGTVSLAPVAYWKWNARDNR